MAAVFLAAGVLVKPIGVSTPFVVVVGILGDLLQPELEVVDDQGVATAGGYLGKYAGAVVNPLNDGLLFVLAMVVGGWIARLIQGTTSTEPPPFHRARFGERQGPRLALAFLGGIAVLFGARLAGGCTSGHMMSGMMRTALSGYLFTAAAFAAVLPTAIWLYGKGANE